MDPFFLFLKKPVLGIDPSKKSPIFLLYLFYIAFAAFFGMLILFIVNMTGIQSIAMSEIDKYTLTEKILKVIILAPVIEETLFRLLLRFNRYTVKIFFAITLAYCVYLIFREKYMMLMAVLSFQFLLLIFMGVFSINKISVFVKNHFTVIFYISVLAFGTIHLLNFKLTTDSLYFLPFIVLPQLIAGTMLGYIKISYSFMHGIAFHMLINLMILLR
jgi:hypothetical protein